MTSYSNQIMSSAGPKRIPRHNFKHGGGAMKNGVRVLTRLLVSLAIGAVTVTVVGFDGQSVVQAIDHEMKIEVTITDLGYKVQGHTTPDALTVITVHNKGSIPHGITSPLFSKAVPKKEGDGTEFRGPGVNGFRDYHLAPGETMRLHFDHSDSTSRASQETMQVPLWCDIHTHMRGEFLIVEAKGGT